MIQLNLIHSVNTILEALQTELDFESNPAVDQDDYDVDPDIPAQSTSTSRPARSPPKITEKHRLLKFRLAPLRRIETDLRRRLGASSSDDFDNVNGSSQPTYATPFDALSTTTYPPHNASISSTSRRRRIGTGGGEVVVRSWKYLLQAEDRVSSSSSRGRRESEQGGQQAQVSHADEATDVIASCKADIKALWEDSVVQAVLIRRKVKLADSAGL